MSHHDRKSPDQLSHAPPLRDCSVSFNKVMKMLWILTLAGLVHFRCALPITGNLICTVTHDSTGSHYKITGNENTPCPRYQWTDGADDPLAISFRMNKSESAKVVQHWNNTYLHLSDCVENVTLRLICPKQDYEIDVPCSVNCTESPDGAWSLVLIRSCWGGSIHSSTTGHIYNN
ncbi:uncharacterized protein LOC144061950 isoform X2 [Vanacampus margaritifer]